MLRQIISDTGHRLIHQKEIYNLSEINVIILQQIHHFLSKNQELIVCS